MPAWHMPAPSPVQALGEQEHEQEQQQEWRAPLTTQTAESAALQWHLCTTLRTTLLGTLIHREGLLELLPCDDSIMIAVNGFEKPLLTLWQLRRWHLIYRLRSL